METNYYSPSPSGGNENNQWKMHSLGGVLSWALLIITSWCTFFQPEVKFAYYKDEEFHRGLYFWLYPCFPTSQGVCFALYIYYLFFYPLLILCFIIFIAGFGAYIYCLFIRRDSNVINAMFGQFSRFHYVPFICASVLFIISECTKDDEYWSVDPSKFQIFLTIVISFIGLVSMAFIYFRTQLEYPIYAKLTINRGTYSCLLVLFSFGFFYNIFYYGVEVRDGKKNFKDWIKGCCYALPIIFGVVNLSLSFLFKDFVLAGINCIMFIGMTINFFLIDDELTEYYFNKGKGVGIIDIIMGLLSGCLATFLFIRNNPFRVINQNNY